MAEKKKRLSQIEQREKLIKDRAARLAKDAKKQGITPEALLKKKKDTYLTVASPLIGLLPFGAIARGATSLFKAVKTAKKAKDVGKALKTSKTPTKNVSKTPKKVEKKTPKKQKKENVLAKRKEKQKRIAHREKERKQVERNEGIRRKLVTRRRIIIKKNGKEKKEKEEKEAKEDK